MLEWDDARYLLALHRAGSLSEAGRKLGVNQSTVGRRLTALESTLGARLFFRTRDGFVLAPAGERLLPHAERMEDEAHAIEREISGQEARVEGTVRITAPDALSERIVVPLLCALRGRYPDIRLELVANNRILNLSKREADLAIRTGRPTEPQLVARKVCDFLSAPYASSGYLASRGKAEPPDFAGHEFIGWDEPLTSTPEAGWTEQRARKGRVVFRTSSSHGQLRAVQGGMGIGILPFYLGDPERELVRLGGPGEVIPRAIWLIVHKDLQHAARVRATVEFLAEGIGAQAGLFEGRGGGARRPTRGGR